MSHWKSLYTFLCLALCIGYVNAQTIEVTVAGSVSFGPSEEPAREFPVWIYTNEERTTVFTNTDGSFSANVKFTLDDTDRGIVTVDVFDFCTGVAQSETREGLFGDANYQNFHFTICETIDPPSSTGCGAFFSYQSSPENPQTIRFENLSFSGSAMTAWQWDFGDGTTSDAVNPIHTYETNGIFTVTLAMRAEDPFNGCRDSFTTTLVVNDSINYNCPTVFDPVCVATPSGGFIRFPNRCRALEDGYTEDMIVPCEDDCICPDIFDPVCVLLDDGSIREYGNRCEAACEGFGPEDFVTCDDDFCTLELDPVCVVSQGDTLTFTNACFAMKAGFSDEEMFRCQECLDICDAFFGPPVCVQLADGNVERFENECVARCQGFSDEDFVACDTSSCDCPTDEYIPVCVILPSGEIREYVSACWAKCDGFTEEDFIDCEDSCICPQIFDPVCVVVDQDTLRFANRCYAACEGFGPDQYFSCRDDSDCGCPRIYEPVCVKINGEIREFPNECVAACHGFTPENFVACESGGCFCPEYYDPVCTVVNGDTLTFDNICFARCEGFAPDQLFTCNPQRDCICTLEYDPVCVVTASGEIREFSNACVAECEGYTEEDFVDCPVNCDCPFEIYEPVCVVENGDTLRFDNPCFAECAGYTPDQWFHCLVDPVCSCPLNLDPVCVIVDGVPRRFPNPCTAECFGFTEVDFVDCDSIVNDCNCVNVFDPVCVVEGQDTITYTNRCFALCDGYTVEDFIDCPNEPDQECFADFLVRRDNPGGPGIAFRDISYTSSGNIQAWRWDLGDGTSAEGAFVRHTYRDPGLYPVTLTIITNDGCSASITREVFISEDDIVQGPRCQAMFFFRQHEDAPRTFQFEDLSLGNVVSWRWNFGDGNTSNRQNPTHTFGYNGIFYVQLVVHTADGCESRTNMIVYVEPDIVYDNACRAAFVPFVYADSLQVFFRNLSSEDAVEYRWDFGDGTTSTERNPEHMYASTGIYDISLTINTADGCTNTFEAIINMASQNFTGAPTFRTTTTSTSQAPVFESFQLYPNPAYETLRLAFSMPKAAPYQLSIYTLEGKALRTSTHDAMSGNNNIQLAIGELPPGMYLLRIQSHEHAKVVKFVKQ